MMCLDVCAWAGSDHSYCYLYIMQTTLSFVGFFFNLVICIFAFSGDRFSPHTAMFRTLMLGDLLSSLGFIIDSISALLQRNSDTLTGPPEMMFVSVSTCVANKPHLFILQTARQWTAVLVMIMGIERYLFITYPLWFKVVRVRRLPILVFTTCFVLLSSGIAYTNALFIDPGELTHFTCEVTWAFGDNYGWCQTTIVVMAISMAFVLNFYSYRVVKQDSALLHFGNNRTRMNSERRKIRKAMWIIGASVLACVFPQIIVSVLRVINHMGLQKTKMLISQLFLLKFVANFVLLAKLSRVGPGLSVFAPRCCTMSLRKARIDHTDSIASVSYYVN
ncbi:unnamed protein product [Bursaphelenchus xylophilus]|uniref:(pine wood nematode) hypothetical protein n=1 Tax=Bursaphelenchus xylophilus TaxID=6326 RepID=A0A1I7S3T8_BURXY|nr:unnamed protein product [Bursaphelenchus xylophilus]CAG9116510.1 unnamed protein product [Bursaphelenchus xylophilus]